MVSILVADGASDNSWSIPLGTPVYDVVGEKLGSVRDADTYTLSVEEGLIIITTYLVPMSLVDRYEHGALHLSVTKAEASGKGAPGE